MALDQLFAPLKIGDVELRNRIISTSHQTTMVQDHLPTADFIAYQEARARGGVGLIIMEAVAVSPSGLLTAHTIGGYLEEMVAGYGRILEAVRPHGARLFVQLFHGGREMISSAPRPVVVSSSAIPSHRYHTEPRALSAAEVREIVAAYGQCAEVAAQAGLDGIEVSAAHGYLFEQFFNSAYNDRSDEYAEPARALLEVLQTLRVAAPGLALGVRLSGDSAAARQVVPHIAATVDYVHVTTGNSATFDGCVGIVPPLPTARNAVAAFTSEFKVGVPVIATARVVEPEDADALIGRGVADAIGMNRALITDPDMPNKARDGRGSEILRCIACNACIAHYHAETPLRCAQNPRTGRERTMPRTRKATATRRVVVVGGGPAGMAAAAEAGASGHDVVLLEQRELGGQVRLAGRSPTHAELASTLLANYAQLLKAGRVKVEVGTRADPAVIQAYEPDLVISATGARPFSPRRPLPGVEVVQVWDILAGAQPEGELLIADWGGDPAALDCAEMLAQEGRAVTLAVGAVSPGETLHQYSRNVYIARLLRAGVQIENWLALDSTEPGRAVFRNIFAPDLTRVIECEVLALSLGRVPNQELEAELEARGLRCVTAGDCRSPRTIEEAILEGTSAAIEVSEAALVGTPG